MKLDKLFSHSFNREGVSQKIHTLGKGKLTGFLVQTDNLFTSDKISVKVRGKERTEVLLNRTEMRFLDSYSNANLGTSYNLGLGRHINQLYEQMVSHVTGFAGGFAFDHFAGELDTVYVDVGHITLDLAEVEFKLETALTTGGESSGTYTVYAVHQETKPDFYKQYDITRDRDVVQRQISEIYFVSRTPIYQRGELKKDIQFQIDTDEGTMLNDSLGALALTNIFGNIEHHQVLLATLFREDSPIQGSCRVKIDGQLHDEDHLLFVRKIIPKEVSTATKNNLQELKTKVEKLERENGELAKRMRHSGDLVTSEELAEALEAIKQGEHDEEQG